MIIRSMTNLSWRKQPERARDMEAGVPSLRISTLTTGTESPHNRHICILVLDLQFRRQKALNMHEPSEEDLRSQ